MLPLALNLLALLIVVGLCWAAMVWLGARNHGQSRSSIPFEPDYFDQLGSPRASGDSDDSAVPGSPDEPCTVCEGVGAQQTQGKLAPCPECLGTGVLSQA